MPDQLSSVAEKAEFSEIVHEARGILKRQRGTIELSIGAWNAGLSKWDNAISVQGRLLRQRFEAYLKRDTTVLDWLDNRVAIDEGGLAVADYLESQGEIALWMARDEMGGERIIETFPPGAVTEQENESLLRAERVFYLARSIRDKLTGQH
ncbi:hypothetical protein COS81_03565 [candidate division WWE3 bacterium CG06_land_8_20_14_3_00_42_16]|uniref:Uncharacterized protein n=3 Tax=Katanobacteria TaxID=422282 RepID=A0A2M7AMD3_UNCKA|nr:MAG: hypothetical protein AUJ38_03045 [bacterium CG1_02_42_9]PIU68535.1 MAG: hypothetical protein COS81_03565 [candidate division WWE3 bacterium CG06_land_8_20_14_3_00_42_16]PJA37162.1 MAG: hypothetical protein CO181_04745 [candidate division WWE3 bacterium CG_4_9_14_3_um_filter_43_9]